jgi:hypothetical protein
MDITDPSAVTILNILNIDPIELAQWVSYHLLNVKIPRPNANTSVSTLMPQVQSLISDIPNKMCLATELYGVVIGAKANNQAVKRITKNTEVENAITLLGANEAILYRAIQTLQTLYDGASRLITIGDQQIRMGK